MIPKIIHYCWLSNDPVPALLQQYMDTWHRLMPDYEFVKWDFSRFDKQSSAWVSEAFDNKKYAFAADYIRMFALYTMGGIYLDMDVEVLKPFDNLLHRDYFLCKENSNSQCPEVAAFGAAKGCVWVGDVLNYYTDRHFCNNGTFDETPLPKVVQNIWNMNKYKQININTIQSMGGGKKEIEIFPCEYFSPKSWATGKIETTKNTYCIHHFSGSWKPKEQQLEYKIRKLLGLRQKSFTYHIDKLLYKWFGVRR